MNKKTTAKVRTLKPAADAKAKKQPQQHEFRLLDRIVLSGALPTQGNIKTLTIVRDIQKKIGLTQDDFKKYGIKFEKTTASWNAAGEKVKFKYEFTELERLEIVNALKKLSSREELSMELLGVCEKFGVTGE